MEFRDRRFNCKFSQTINDQFLSPEQLDAMALENVGTTTLDPSVTLIATDDTLENEVATFYFDVVYEMANEWTVTNKLFYEEYDNLNENAYGFSQFHIVMSSKKNSSLVPRRNSTTLLRPFRYLLQFVLQILPTPMIG